MCRSRRDDTELVRAGRTIDGTWYVGRGTGRGVWWCADSACGEGLRSSHVARAVRGAVSERDMAALAVAVQVNGLDVVVKE